MGIVCFLVITANATLTPVFFYYACEITATIQADKRLTRAGSNLDVCGQARHTHTLHKTFHTLLHIYAHNNQPCIPARL